MRRHLLILALTLTCGGVAVAQTSCPEPGAPNAVIESWSPQSVTEGRNIGEKKAEVIAGHPSSATTWTLSWRRVADSAGNAIAVGKDTGVLNTQSYSMSGSILNGPCDSPVGNGCVNHHVRAVTCGSNDGGIPGTINFEDRLASFVSDPGVYTFTIGKASAGGGATGDSLTFSRNWNIQPNTYPVTIHVKDPSGFPVPGCTITVEKPWIATWGPSDASGTITLNVPAQRYFVNAAASGYKAQNQFFFRVRDTPNAINSNSLDLVMIPNSSPSTYVNAQISVVVVDNVNQKPIANAVVYLNGKQFKTDANGEVYTGGFYGGQQVEIIISAAGYYGKYAVVSVNSQQENRFRYPLDRNSNSVGGGTDDGTGGTGGNFTIDWTALGTLLQQLFVPSSEEVQNWRDLGDRIAEWGPFGLVQRWSSDLNLASRSGAKERHLPFFIQLWGAGSTPHLAGCIDLRATDQGAYPQDCDGDGVPDHGTIFGDWYTSARRWSGAWVYGLFILGLAKQYRTRVSI